MEMHLGKTITPARFLVEMQNNLSAEEAMQNFLLKHGADVLGYLADMSVRWTQLENSRDVALVLLHRGPALGSGTHQHLMAFAAIAQDSEQG